MCEVGDIIVIDNYKDGDVELSRHSFVVVQNEGGCIKGLRFDIIALVMSSFKNEKHRHSKLQYDNIPVAAEEQDIRVGGNGKDGYIKANQFYYFQLERLRYRAIGSLKPEVLETVLDYINSYLMTEPKLIIDNLY